MVERNFMQKCLAHARLNSIHPSIALARKKIYTKHLGEEEILSLCDLFLTPGLHYVSFGSLEEGRRIINSFIELLQCYHAIGYIDRVGIHNRGMNLYEQFANYQDDAELRKQLDAFFAQDFAYDFMWIIYPKYQVARTFINIFLDQVIEFSIDQKIPVVFIST